MRLCSLSTNDSITVLSIESISSLGCLGTVDSHGCLSHVRAICRLSAALSVGSDPSTSATALTLLDKSGPNKRAALKAPPSRIARSGRAVNARSPSGEAGSRTQSSFGTPLPEPSQTTDSSNVPSQQESSSHLYGSNSGARQDDETDAVDLTPSRTPVPVASRIPTVPTIISSIPEQGSSQSRAVPPISTVDSGKASRKDESTDLQGQNCIGGRSLRGTGRVEREVGPSVNVNNGPTSTSKDPPRASKRRRRTGRDVQPTNIEADGDSPNQGIEQALSNGTRIQGQVRNSLEPENVILAKPKSTRKRKPKKSAQEVADEVVAEATGGADRNGGHADKRKRRRRLGSEEAENHKIVPTEVKMADLVKDQGLGKGSRTEAEMQKIDWAEIKKKRRQAEEEAFQDEKKQKESRKKGAALPPAGPHAAERLVLVNGQIIVDESSRVIDRNAATARDAEQLGEAINEDRLTKRVNQMTVGKKRLRTYSTWDDEETEQFYQGLRMFGTDFMMISKMFSGTSRSHIKKKFNKEERLHPEKVFAALNEKEPVDLQAFSAMTDTVFEDPKDFYKELEEEQARLEAEDARMRAQEAEDEQEIQESIEQEGEGQGSEGEAGMREPRTRKSRLAAEAQSIVDGAISSKKKKSKKTPSSKKKEGRKGKGMPAEGTEEMVGSIENFEP